MKILGFIPARSGSKELKNKNLKIFDGNPLIYYSIEIGKKNKSITPFVSTDSKKILNFAKKKGIKFNYLRPKSLSEDNSKVIDAVLHALKWLNKNNLHFDAVMLLQPTSPIRIQKEIEKIIVEFKKKNLQSIASAVEHKDIPDTLKLNKNNKWKYIIQDKNRSPNRQNYKNKFYTIDGSLYLSKVSFLKKNKSFIDKNNTKIFISSIYPMVDINNILDFKIAEFLKKKIYRK
jgi:CMP-N,N'-diacetyllegionaminic acid synthase